MKNFIFIFACLISLNTYAQNKKVLFIGNSYTGYNNLSQMVYNVALSTGDTLIFDKHTPGGNRLMDHASNATAMAKIKSDNWDHVVLQAQSQEPSFPIAQVQTEVFPFAEILCDSIRANDNCSRPIFYMTWGRENGDASNCVNWPPVCTYDGMDSLLNLRYRMMGDDNEAYVAPVGAVWHYLRDNYPDIDLYTADGSHPSVRGSYVGACTFYTIIYQKDPNLITFNSSLTDDEATAIKEATKIIVFDNLAEWNVGTFDPVAQFSLSQNEAEVSFTNTSQQADTYLWNFGDGNTSSLFDPTPHTYSSSGTYTVTLELTDGCDTSIFSEEVEIMLTGINQLESKWSIDIFPNPNNGQFTLLMDGLSGRAKISINKLSGENLHHWNFTGNGATENMLIDVDDLMEGIYLLRVTTDEGERTLKLLIQ